MSESNILEVAGREHPEIIDHGTRRGYKKFKCGCDECREWWNDYMRGYRARRMDRTGERMSEGRFVKNGR
jgi:hypothetical protein